MRQLPWMLTAALACACSACSPAPDAATPSPAATAASNALTASPTSSAAASIGIDLAGIDHSVKPGDDFFQFANGSWLKTAEIPADRSSTGTFLKVFKATQKQTAELIKNAGASEPVPDSSKDKIADYYAAFMNTAAINKAGLKPLQPRLDAIQSIDSREDLAQVLGRRLRADVDPINATDFHTNHLFGLFVTKGLHGDINIPYLLQGGLSMPSREYYLSDAEAMVGFRDAYKTYIAALLMQAKVPNPEAKAETVLELETKIAKAQASLLESQDVHNGDNLWSVTDFAEKAPGLDWSAFFKAAGLEDIEQFDVWQPAATTKLSALVASASLSSWQALLTFHTLDRNAPLLPEAFADLHFGFHDKTLQGTPEQRARWKRAVAATSDDLGDAVGQLYVQNYFPASSKKEVRQLVDNLVVAFGERVQKLDWMTPETKAKAKTKVGTLRVSVGYPETWRDYSSLEISPNDALGNHLRAEKFEYVHQKSKLGTPINKAEWWMTPQTVNAVNLPLQNAMNFPAAILQPPFFDPDADPAVNYGAIGAIIGHEISHSFDNLGSEFDAQGNLDNWWTEADSAHFEAAAKRLVEQYDQYEPLPGVHVSGERTLGENIADVSGLAVALAAYHKSLDGQPAPVIDGLTGDQRFFLAFAQAWRAKSREAALRQRLTTDVHAPPGTRAQTVRNLDAWYEAFDIKADANLYLAPEDRVKIW